MSSGDPTDATVFIVGVNAATEFPTSVIPRDDYVEALVAGGAVLREIYLRARATGRPSPTRVNIDRLTKLLLDNGVRGVLETNVWSIPTKSIKDLRKVDRGSREQHESPVPKLLAILMPPAVIVHGRKATSGLATVMGREFRHANDSPVLNPGTPNVWVTPSLSPPAANRWLPSGWSELESMARRIGSGSDHLE